ncbi:MAG: hypothetical protein SGJ27_01515 [Candidatus Melainabacteria bacterium]|nr:hypothetical protein [Candidatus Melainabacteria bacterium]
MDDDKREEEEPMWLSVATTAQSALLAISFLLMIPWRSYYANTLLWDDARGMGFFCGVLAILHALSLVVRTRVVEITGGDWKDLRNYHVVRCGGYFADTLFWGGVGLWCVHDELGVSRTLCYLITSTGTFGCTALYLSRWQLTKSKTDGWFTVAYSVLSLAVTFTFLKGHEWF